jgi:hypothetical protein
MSKCGNANEEHNNVQLLHLEFASQTVLLQISNPLHVKHT